jgi:uncharacterized protein
MERWVNFCLRYKKLLSVFLIVASVIIIYGVKFLAVDVSVDTFVVNQPHLKVQYKSGTAHIVVAIHDKRLFTKDKIKKLKKLEIELKSITNVESATSLMSLPNVRYYIDNNKQQSVITGKEDSPASIKRMLKDASLPVFQGHFINKEDTSLAIYLKIKPENREALFTLRDAIEETVNDACANFDDVYQVSLTEFTYNAYHNTMSDLKLFVGLGVALVLGLFVFTFRSLIVGLLPVSAILLSLAWTFGIIGYCGISVNILSGIVIAFVFSVGASECMHFITSYIKQQNIKDDVEGSMLTMFRLTFVPILLSTFTTVLGFCFNIFSSMRGFSDFAYTICIALWTNFFITLILVPIVLSSVSVCTNRKAKFYPSVYSVFMRINRALVANSRKVLLVIAILFFGGIYLCSGAKLNILPENDLYKTDPVIVKLNKFSEDMSSFKFLDIGISSTIENAFEDPRYLNKLLKAQRKISRLSPTSYTFSLADMVATIYQIYTLELDNPSYYTVPYSKQFIDMLLNNEDMQMGDISDFNADLVNSAHNAVRLYTYYNVKNSSELLAYKNKIQTIIGQQFKSPKFQFNIRSDSVPMSIGMLTIINLQMISLATLIFAVFISVAIMFRSVKAGLVSLVPNILPLVLLLSIFGALNIALSLGTVIIFAMILGLAVDDTIHILYEYSRQIKLGNGRDAALANALEKQVMPVTLTSIAISVVMIMLVVSKFKITMQFGVFSSAGVIFAWLADMVVTPFLLVRFDITKGLMKGRIKNNKLA